VGELEGMGLGIGEETGEIGRGKMYGHDCGCCGGILRRVKEKRLCSNFTSKTPLRAMRLPSSSSYSFSLVISYIFTYFNISRKSYLTLCSVLINLSWIFLYHLQRPTEGQLLITSETHSRLLSILPLHLSRAV
jgi:hypothetical protein